MKSPQQVVLEFVSAINTGNQKQIASLMTEDHKFIDANGTEFSSKNFMKHAWKNFYLLFPDYKIEIEEIFENESTIAIFGKGSGTYGGIKTSDNKNYFRISAVWRAVVENEKIKSWTVIGNIKSVEIIVQRNRKNIRN